MINVKTKSNENERPELCTKKIKEKQICYKAKRGNQLQTPDF